NTQPSMSSISGLIGTQSTWGARGSMRDRSTGGSSSLLDAAERGRGWAVISAGRGRFLGRHIDGLAELVRRLGVGGHFEPFRLRSAEPLWTAFFPLLSLRTTYWGSSGDAATVRPASSRRSVTFSST